MAQRETTVKQQRLAHFLERHDLDGVLLQHRANFAWVTNGRLHDYYKALGFDHVRTEVVEGRGSGALFIRPASYRHGSVDLVDLVDGHLRTAGMD